MFFNTCKYKHIHTYFRFDFYTWFSLMFQMTPKLGMVMQFHCRTTHKFRSVLAFSKSCLFLWSSANSNFKIIVLAQLTKTCFVSCQTERCPTKLKHVLFYLFAYILCMRIVVNLVQVPQALGRNLCIFSKY